MYHETNLWTSTCRTIINRNTQWAMEANGCEQNNPDPCLFFNWRSMESFYG